MLGGDLTHFRTTFQTGDFILLNGTHGVFMTMGTLLTLVFRHIGCFKGSPDIFRSLHNTQCIENFF